MIIARLNMYTRLPPELIRGRTKFDPKNIIMSEKEHMFFLRCNCDDESSKCDFCDRCYDKEKKNNKDDDNRHYGLDNASKYLKYGMIMYHIADECPGGDTAIVVSVSPPRVIYPRIRVTDDNTFILGVDKTKQLEYKKCTKANRAKITPFVEVPPDYIYDVYDIDTNASHMLFPCTVAREDIDDINYMDNDRTIY